MCKRYKYLIIHLSEQMVMFGIRLHVYWILVEDVFRVFYEYFMSIYEYLRVFTSIDEYFTSILRVFRTQRYRFL